MTTIDKNQLMDQLAQHGYALMRPRLAEAGEKLLVNLLKQNDSRFLEGFPVVLADLMRENGTLGWENKNWRADRELSEKNERRLGYLLALSYYLFRLFGFKKFEERTMKLLSKVKWGNQTLLELNGPFMKSQSFKMDCMELSTERFKNNFRNYAVEREESAEVQKKKRALELDLLLSELFTSRQKELLKKRLEDKRMTKTEREYFYRVVSKRLKALANEELHQMARDLVLKSRSRFRAYLR